MSVGIVAVPMGFLCWPFLTALPHTVHLSGRGDSSGLSPLPQTSHRWHLAQTPGCAGSVLSVCLSVYPSIYLSDYNYLCLSISLSLFLCLYFLYKSPNIYIYTHTLVYVNVPLNIYTYTHTFIYMYLYIIYLHLPADLSISTKQILA